MPTYRITKPYMMKSKPIIFNAEMVRAILKGTKTQTRRVLRPQPVTPDAHVVIKKDKLVIYERAGKAPGLGDIDATLSFPLLYGVKGDFLWVRETFRETQEQPGIIYRADGWEDVKANYHLKWSPSIHMPRWASRITLKITKIRVERVQEISIEDIKAEGTDFHYDPRKAWHEVYRNKFTELWDLINAKRGYSWESDPWVFVITFERLEKEA